MPEWIQSGSIYYVQPTESSMTDEEYRGYLDKIYAKIEAAKLKFEQKEKGMTA